MQPILLDLGFIQLRYYGLMYAIGLLFALLIVSKEFKRRHYPFTPDQTQNFVLLVFISGLVFARLYYVLFNLGWYFGGEAPWYEFLAVWHGGVAIHGGIIGGACAMAFYAYLKKFPFFKLTDVAVLAVPLGQAIGRIGNFMNGDAHGVPTTLPWGVVFKYGPAAAEFPGQPLHPVMLYESLLNLTSFLILWSLRTKNYKPGLLSVLYLLFYAAIRSFVTIFRADDLFLWGIFKDGHAHWLFDQTPEMAYGLRAPHAISLVMAAVVVFMLFYCKLYEKAEPENSKTKKD